MLTRRALLLLAFAAALLIARDVVSAALFAGPAVNAPTIELGPVRIDSVFLKERPAPDNQTVATADSATTELDWQNEDAQQLLGPIRVTAVWSSNPPREWLSPDSVCSYIFERFGVPDEISPSPRFSKLNSSEIHDCEGISSDSGRMWMYVFALSERRCTCAALVVARIPWEYMGNGDDIDALNARFNAHEARVAHALGDAEMPPDKACRSRMRGASYIAMGLPLLLFPIAGVLLSQILKRSSDSVS
jgi:hypothetical protein